MSSNNKRDLRRSIPIMAYTGANGHGKTLAMVYDTLPSLDAGRPVLSTVRLLDWRNPRPCEDEGCTFPNHPEHGASHPGWVPLDDWELLISMPDCDVLFDEIGGVASSRDTSALPSIVGDMFQQMRRSDRVVRWTAPSYALGDIQLRRVTQGVTVCRGYYGKAVEGRLWRQKRLFRWKTYDTTHLMDDQVVGLTATGRARSVALADERPVVRQLFYGVGSEVFAAYDTYSPVLRIGTAGETGRCLVCGGRISVPVCKCAARPGRRRRLDELTEPGGEGSPAERGVPFRGALAGSPADGEGVDVSMSTLGVACH